MFERCPVPVFIAARISIGLLLGIPCVQNVAQWAKLDDKCFVDLHVSSFDTASKKLVLS